MADGLSSSVFSHASTFSGLMGMMQLSWPAAATSGGGSSVMAAAGRQQPWLPGRLPARPQAGDQHVVCWPRHELQIAEETGLSKTAVFNICDRAKKGVAVAGNERRRGRRSVEHRLLSPEQELRIQSVLVD
ncbi:MAG: hypothetical protein P4L83_19950 [Nevskia sp.]|nr:hypothetical protein [Nevskia sp.]